MIRSMTSAVQRPGWRDVAITLALSALGVVMMIANVNDDTTKSSVAAVPLFLLVTLPLLWRRSVPLAATAAMLGALLVHIALFGTIVRCGVAFPTAFLLAFAVGARLDRRESLVGLVLALGAPLAMCLSDTQVGPLGAVFFVPLTGAVWGIGRVVRSRSLIVGELEKRSSELRAARDDRAELEVATDRARLSAELEELLQRRLGELARLADGGPRGDAAAATATLLEIERESRRTLDEMRTVVGALRHDSADAPMAPQPTLTHLEALLLRAKGSDARLAVEGSFRALPAGVELSAYRVIEHLLEALDDAPDVDVLIKFDDDALELSVSGPARRRGDAAPAIERARERIQLHRGTLHATTRGGRAEAIARIPVLAGA